MFPRSARLTTLLVCVLLLAASVVLADHVELRGGIRIEGEIIEQTERFVRMRVKASGKEVNWPLGQVVAVTVGGERQVVTAPAPAPALATDAPAVAEPAAPPAEAGGREVTPLEADALIYEEGRKQPDWWDSVQVNYPSTLDLNWEKPTEPWDAKKNVGQFIWEIISSNPSRWREGVKFVHQLLIRNQNSPLATQHAMDSLANMYHNLLQDWPRAAFWLQQIGRRRGLNTHQRILLANCYWRMGCRVMAVDTVSNMRIDIAGGRLIQLWADMGKLQTALNLAEATAQIGAADSAYLAAGNACRQYGHYPQALDYYRRSLAFAQRRKNNDLAVKRARANIEAIVLFESLDLSRVPDGTYEDESMAFNGQVRVAVTVRGGRIESVEIRRHKEKQFHSAFTETVGQIVAKQGVGRIDATSGATVTSSAVTNATAKALSKAMK